jgi:hypothetical protein
MRSLMLFVAVAASLLAAANVALADRHSAAATCANFRVTTMRPNGDVVLSNKVVQLRTMDVTCKTAHAIAKQIVTDILLGKRVPARINGYRITVVKPCRGCTPVWHIVASGANGSFTFVSRGGA